MTEGSSNSSASLQDSWAAIDGRRIAFGYKGGRDYVHGTDQYAAFRSLAGDVEGVELRTVRFHAMLRGDGVVERWDSARVHEYATGLVLQRGGESAEFGVLDQGRPSLAERPYPEDDIVACADLSLEGVILESSTGFDGIEEVVALIKVWCNTHLPVSGKWLFARIDRKGSGGVVPATRAGRLDIVFANSVARRFARFEVRIDGVQALVTFGVDR